MVQYVFTLTKLYDLSQEYLFVEVCSVWCSNEFVTLFKDVNLSFMTDSYFGNT